MLQDIVEQIEAGGAKSAKAGGELKIGVSVLPTLPAIAGDRNRTSPFAFTGNKFEFRAVGSAQSIAGPIVVLNTIVAETLDEFATQLEQAVAAKKDLNTEIQKLLQAASRRASRSSSTATITARPGTPRPSGAGLPNRRSTIDSLPDLVSPKSMGLFTKYGVLNERELHSRYEIFLENYRKTINIESQLTIQIAQRMILPAALRYQAAGGRGHRQPEGHGRRRFPRPRRPTSTSWLQAIEALQTATDRLSEAVDEPAKGDSLDHAKYARDVIIPAMNAVRAAGDQLETLVADDLWPLPTYQEMLFIK